MLEISFTPRQAEVVCLYGKKLADLLSGLIHVSTETTTKEEILYGGGHPLSYLNHTISRSGVYIIAIKMLLEAVNFSSYEYPLNGAGFKMYLDVSDGLQVTISTSDQYQNYPRTAPKLEQFVQDFLSEKKDVCVLKEGLTD